MAEQCIVTALSVLQAPSNIQKILNLEHYLYQARQEAVAVTAAEPEPEAKAVAVGPSPGGSGRAAVRGRGGVRAKMALRTRKSSTAYRIGTPIGQMAMKTYAVA